MQIIHGDCLKVLRSLPEHSVDAICSDPPAGIDFMGKDWDKDKGGRDVWIAWLAEIMSEARRVVKPGGHAFIWALPRTSHWTALALENAGWEIRDRVEHVLGSDTLTQNFLASLNEEQRTALDMLLESEQSSTISHVFGSGFPKSHNISIAIDKHLKAEREVIGQYDRRSMHDGYDRTSNGDTGISHCAGRSNIVDLTAPATPLAQQYSGFGTALKPAHEVWWLCRAPLSEKTIAENVLKHGTGGLNIDGTRVGTAADMNPRDFDDTLRTSPKFSGILNGGKPGEYRSSPGTVPNGRFPSNFLLSHSLFCTEEQCIEGCAVLALDRQSGISKDRERIKKANPGTQGYGIDNPTFYTRAYGDQGGASRYFQTFYYCPKPSKRERNAGCDELSEKQGGSYEFRNRDSGKGQFDGPVNVPATNHHPTVKPAQLMQYLCRLITPPGGTVLDPFMGSGTTGVACIQEGFDFIGIEREPEYIEIARARIEHAQKLHAGK